MHQSDWAQLHQLWNLTRRYLKVEEKATPAWCEVYKDIFIYMYMNTVIPHSSVCYVRISYRSYSIMWEEVTGILSLEVLLLNLSTRACRFVEAVEPSRRRNENWYSSHNLWSTSSVCKMKWGEHFVTVSTCSSDVCVHEKMQVWYVLVYYLKVLLVHSYVHVTVLQYV